MLLTTKQLAEELGMHPETIRRFARRRTIPVVNWVGKKQGYRFDLKKVMESLEK